jgi:hypothetical protein
MTIQVSSDATLRRKTLSSYLALHDPEGGGTSRQEVTSQNISIFLGVSSTASSTRRTVSTARTGRCDRHLWACVTQKIPAIFRIKCMHETVS